MYLKDLEKRITLRLTEEVFDEIVYRANELCVTPSRLIRMVMDEYLNRQREVRYEDDKTDIDGKL